LTRFAAPFVVVIGAGCGSPPVGGDDDDDGDDDAARIPDARDIDAYVTENPPAPSLGFECYEQPALVDGTTQCQSDVCARDESCCAEGWDARCVELARASCDGLVCPTALTTGGVEHVGYAWGPGSGLASDTIQLAGDGPVSAPAWQLESTERAAVATECGGRVLARTTSDPTALVEVFAHALEGCEAEPFGGRRARWVDVDHDGTIDVVFAGGGGAWWARGEGANAFTYQGVLIAAADGDLADVGFVDVDHDLRVDAIAAFADGAARWYRQTPARVFEAQAWTSGGAGFTELAICDVAGDAGREVVLTGPSATEAYPLADDDLGASLFTTAPGGGSHVACGESDPQDGKQDVVLARVDGAIAILDGDGATRWSSTVDLDPPLAIDAAGVASTPVGVAVAPAAADGDRPLIVIVGDAVDAWDDPAPGVAAIGVSAAP
jgi:hypothetical protein